MALIIGHSQLKYFSEYVQDSSIQCLFSSGCTVEELATFPSVKVAVPAASYVKPVTNCFRVVVCLNSSLGKFSWLVQR